MNPEQKEREAYLKEIGIDKTKETLEMDKNGDIIKILSFSWHILEECEKRKYTLQDTEMLIFQLKAIFDRNAEILRQDSAFKAHIQPRKGYQVAGQSDYDNFDKLY